MTVALILPVAACVFSLGVGLWVICSQLMTEDIPAEVDNPWKLRIFSYIFQLMMTWGMIFEKLGFCYRTEFVSFLHDLPPLKKHPGVVVTDLHFGTIPVKLYRPETPSSRPRPGVIFFHGGGSVVGSLKTHHNFCSHLCKKSDSVVLAVRYHKSPRHKFPQMMKDCTVATIHFLKSLDLCGVDPARVIVCGDSVGGGLAALTCQLFVNRPDLPKIRAQILIYAVLQALDFQSPSFQQNRNIPMLTWDFAFYCWCSYLDISPTWKSIVEKGAHLPPEVWEKYRKWLGPENIPERFKKRGYQSKPFEPVNEDAYLETRLARQWTCSPLIAEDNIVSQLPEACIVSCEYDLLCDHSLLYKKRLEDLGVPVTWHHVENGFHGMLTNIEKGFFHFPSSLRILDVIVDFIKGL
ncbi:arylacetamide deacetylase-like 3 [Octodon degus]|uniref:Arylacetamide deacetylase-like 3 n=1 Tax=Octodon degus TaxID=10160 RepID=A0A6P3FZC4_OCTDE|nr:arylacetamide deacetylase-like 3 [Octodon degus]